MTLDFDLDRVFLAFESMIVDDDQLGASHGDGDGIIEYDETIELTLSLKNIGQWDAHGVTGSISSSSPYLGIAQDQLTFGDIPAGAVVACSAPLVLHVARDVPDLTRLMLDVAVSEDPGRLPLMLEARAPSYLVSILALDDGLGGDGLADPGETVAITLQIENRGGAPTPPVMAELGTACDYFIPAGDPQSIDPIVPGGQTTLASWDVEIAATCPPVYCHYLRTILSGPQFYLAALPITFTVGEIFADNLEAGSASWTHYVGPGTWTDQWHVETHRNHTYGGESSWKCGGLGAEPYGNLCYAILETAEFDLPPGGQLSFWHWMDAETSAAYPGYCYDGGLVEISSDGGATWEPLTPEGGYPYLIRPGTSPGPFPAETPVFSGQHDWLAVTVDLSTYAGLMKLRWIFGSDGAETGEGWYLDDVHIAAPPTTAAREPVLSELALRPVCTNPAKGSAHFNLDLPRAGQVLASVHDISGRRIRALLGRDVPAGEHRLTWDGRDGLGRPVRSGTYWVRVAAGGTELNQRVMLVR